MAHAELGVARRARELHVPRTDVLAHVAAEQPVAHVASVGLVELTGMLDGEVGDAAPRVEHARCDECAGWTGVETGAAGAAAIRLEGQVGGEIRVGQHDADEGERAPVGVDQHHVFPDPAEPGPLRQLALGDGSRIDIAAGFRAGDDLADGGGKALQAATEDEMVVGGPRVLGNPAATLPGLAPGVSRAMEVIGERHHRDSRAGHDPDRVFSLVRLPVEVCHGPGVACGQPAIELGGVGICL